MKFRLHPFLINQLISFILLHAQKRIYQLPAIYMKNVLDKIYFSISQLQVEEKTKAHYRRRASKYFNECGCSLGGFFLLLALAGSLVYWIFFDSTFLPSVK